MNRQAALRNLLNKLSFRDKMDSAKASFDTQRTGSRQSKLNDLRFDNKVLTRLPIDREEENYIRTVHNAVSNDGGKHNLSTVSR